MIWNESAEESVARRTPMVPVIKMVGPKENISQHCCPNCGHFVSRRLTIWCSNCGQHIDWSNEYDYREDIDNGFIQYK